MEGTQIRMDGVIKAKCPQRRDIATSYGIIRQVVDFKWCV